MPKIDVNNRKYSFYVGIDCGVITGVAVWMNKQMLLVRSCKIHEAMELIKGFSSQPDGRGLIRVEDARLRKWIPRQNNEKAEKGRREGAGSVKRDAKIWEDFLEDIGMDYELVAPKNNKTKVKSEYFMKITGIVERVSEHARDAAMLVYGL